MAWRGSGMWVFRHRWQAALQRQMRHSNKSRWMPFISGRIVPLWPTHVICFHYQWSMSSLKSRLLEHLRSCKLPPKDLWKQHKDCLSVWQLSPTRWHESSVSGKVCSLLPFFFYPKNVKVCMNFHVFCFPFLNKTWKKISRIILLGKGKWSDVDWRNWMASKMKLKWVKTI